MRDYENEKTFAGMYLNDVYPLEPTLFAEELPLIDVTEADKEEATRRNNDDPRSSSPYRDYLYLEEIVVRERQLKAERAASQGKDEEIARLRTDRDNLRRKYFEMERAQSQSIDQNGEHIKRIQGLERDKDEIRNDHQAELATLRARETAEEIWHRAWVAGYIA